MPKRLTARQTSQAIGVQIRRIAAKRKLTIQALAERSGVEPQRLAEIIHGRVDAFVEELVRVASALDVHRLMLFAGPELGVRGRLIRVFSQLPTDKCQENLDRIEKLKRNENHRSLDAKSRILTRNR